MKPLRSRNNFGVLLDELKLNGFGIEIGVSEGNFSKILLENTNLQRIYFIDPWREYPKSVYKDGTNTSQKIQDARYNMVVERLKKYGEKATIIRKDSVEALVDFSDNYFDFVYIDANHAYEYVKNDMKNWYPKLKVGGIFAGHDYMSVSSSSRFKETVKKAVDEFCKEKGINVLLTGGRRKCPISWYFIKEI